MDRNRVKEITADLNVVLAEFAKKHDLEEVTFKNVKFDSTGFRTTIHAKDMMSFNDRQVDFNVKAMRMGLPTGGFGGTINVNGTTYRVLDINTRAHKYPVIAQDDNGQRYKFNGSVLDDVMVNLP